ncbi:MULTISPECIES: replication initiation protein [Clostridium]|uniref:replication initiation protein n=1 Tax=Clostridium TaxID=1485 RepID=UPI00069EC997|nr:MULTISPECIES: RepB family plasmid replication initiator protein [Clostridium]
MIKKGKFIAVRPDTLIEARYDLKPKQNDILDIVLSKIKEDDEKYRYELYIDDFKKIYKKNVSNIYRDFKKAVKEFEGKGFYLIDNINKKEIFFVWFASILYEDNIGKITVEVGHTLKGLLLKMKKRIYYKIEYPLNFNSTYSKRVYYYLKSFEDTGMRVDNLDVLRKKLDCPKSYDKYSFFKLKVLDKAFKEINDYSDISFEYEEIKEKRKVVAIKFLIKSNSTGINKIQEQEVICKENSNPNVEKNSITVNKIEDVKPEEIPKKNFEENENDEIIFIKNLFNNKLNSIDCAKILTVAKGDLDKIKEAYNIAKQQPKINNLCAWIIACIKGNYTVPVTITNNINKDKEIDIFNDYEQRKYDWTELEKKLLGWYKEENNEIDLKKELQDFLDILQQKGIDGKPFRYYTIDFDTKEIPGTLEGNLIAFKYIIENSTISLINPLTNKVIATKKL